MRRILVVGGWLMFTVAAAAPLVKLGTVNGGATRSTTSGIVLSGVIDSMALPSASNGTCKTATQRLGVGFFPSLIGVKFNGANPAWLELSRLMGRTPDLDIKLYQPSPSRQFSLAYNSDERRWIP